MSTPTPLAGIRRDYEGAPLDEATAEADPFAQFARWLDDAREREPEPTAMGLSTVALDGSPASRVVLLKGCDAEGFVFFTNYDSQKGHELAADPRASLLFYWPSCHRQVRVTGTVAKIDERASDEYFASRPPESRIAAAASPQSQVLVGRAELDARFADVQRQFPEADMRRPAFWGGYRLVPQTIEFWQGRPNRLHDRLRYQRRDDGSWHRVRLAP
jgi:pyridoxamine 5'-phosphate oxidase